MSENTDQQTKNLEDLKHNLRNGTGSIMGCLKEIESYMKSMTEASKAYEKDLDNA